MAQAEKKPFAVLGAGSWGTALAIQLARCGHHTWLWAHHREHAEAMQRERSNTRYMPDIELSDQITPTADLATAVQHTNDVLVVVPSHAFRTTMQACKPYLTPYHRVAWGTKGLEQGSHKLLHQIVREEIGITVPIAAISGPTFAKEVARGLPGAITVASKDPQFAREMAESLHSEYFRTYTSSDVIGVEVGGATKNVMAIAAGIADGLGFGTNTRAALITRGLAEIMRLGISLGAQRETFMGLSGLGDLVLTCSDDQSRNRRFGLAMGQGKDRDDAIEEIGQVVEGYSTTEVIYSMAQQLGVEMPITEQVYNILYRDLPPKEAVHNLMTREITAERFD